jgi:hypothetical protein
MYDVNIFVCNKELSLESILLAHTDLLKLIGEEALSNIKSYTEFSVYLRCHRISDESFQHYYDMKCDRLGCEYGWIETSLAYQNKLQGVSFRELAEDHPEIDFRYLNLVACNLYRCDLRNIDLSYSNLCSTILFGADCRGAKFTGCRINYGTIFDNATFSGAFDVSSVPMACPSEGEFIGWKRVGKYLVKLKIPEDAKRSSATSSMCRCDKALVLGIYDILDLSEAAVDELNVGARGRMVGGGKFEQITAPITYKVGEMVYADSFDEDRWNVCSHGIHFFLDKGDARRYRDDLITPEPSGELRYLYTYEETTL